MEKTNSIAEMVTRKEARKNVTARILNGKQEIWYLGMWLSPKQFDILLPELKYKKDNGKGDNPCKKRDFT